MALYTFLSLYSVYWNPWWRLLRIDVTEDVVVVCLTICCLAWAVMCVYYHRLVLA